MSCWSSVLLYVVKADLLQLGQRAGRTWDESGGLFPNGIVAGHENYAAPHQRRNRIVLAGKGPRRVFIIPGIGSRRLLLNDQRIGLELLAGQSGELILVPHGLIVERKKRCAMRNRNSEEIRMLERPDLRIQRVAHQVQPGTSDLGIVPD